MKISRKMKGITLISLIVTIIILLILAGISIQLIGGSNGILGRASQALDANDKATATEKMELKITYLNMVSYGENTRKATLQELADGLFADKEVEYVKLKNQEVATLKPIDVTGESSFFVKLKDYSYEFEIDENLQLASVDGVKVATGNQETDELKKELEEMKKNFTNLQNSFNTTKNELNSQIEELKNGQNASFSTDVLFEGVAQSGDNEVKDISKYKYLLVYMCFNYNDENALVTSLVNTSTIVYNNPLKIYAMSYVSGISNVNVPYYFKTPTKFYVPSAGSMGDFSNPHICRIEGLK